MDSNYCCDKITRMDHEQRLLSALGPLCEPLHDSITTASMRVHERLPELSHPSMAPIFAHVCRGLTRMSLEGRTFGGWTVLDGQNNVGLTLIMGPYSLRMLHQPANGAVPPPGRNRARRAYCLNPTLSEDLFPPGDRLLGLWACDAHDAVHIRVIRPIGTWSFGGQARADLDFDLPKTAIELEDLAFDGADEDDLFIALPSLEESTDESDRAV